MKHPNKKIEANNKFTAECKKIYRVSRNKIVEHFVNLIFK